VCLLYLPDAKGIRHFLRVETRWCRKVVVVRSTVSGTTSSLGFTFIGVFTIGSFLGCRHFGCFASPHGTQREALQTLGTPSICEGQTFPAQQTPYIHFPHGLHFDLTCDPLALHFPPCSSFPSVSASLDTKLDSMMMIVAKRNIYNPRRELL
jgi:hypothetical protein